MPGTTVNEFSDGRIIAYTVYPMPDGGGMATHEDITEREELNARLKMQFELGKQQEKNLRIRNLQFDTAINNMSQGLCFFDAAHRLIVCNDRYVEMYGLPRDRVGPGTALAEIVDMRFEIGSFPAMSREEYLDWRINVAISAEPTDSIVELRNGCTFKIRHRPMPDGGWVTTHEDITEQRRSEVKIEYMAHHNALTNLANRVLLKAAGAGLGPQNSSRTDRRGSSPRPRSVQGRERYIRPSRRRQAPENGRGPPARAGWRDRHRRRGWAGMNSSSYRPPSRTCRGVRAGAQHHRGNEREPFDLDGHQAVIGASVGIAVGPGDG